MIIPFEQDTPVPFVISRFSGSALIRIHTNLVHGTNAHKPEALQLVRGHSHLMLVLVDCLKNALDWRTHRFGIEQPLGEVTREIAWMSLGTERHGEAVPLSNARGTGTGKRKKPPGQRSIVR